MNVAGLIFLAFVIVAAYSCIRSDWDEFDEEDETSDDDNPYDGSNGV